MKRGNQGINRTGTGVGDRSQIHQFRTRFSELNAQRNATLVQQQILLPNGVRFTKCRPSYAFAVEIEELDLNPKDGIHNG